jgi:hypothetical protein
VISSLVKEWIVGRRQVRRAELVRPDYARERARRGAAYLDDVAPGWIEDVDPLSLDLADGTACVLGQLHGSFAIGLGRAGIFSLSSAPRASFSPVDLGFHCVQGVGEDLQEQDHTYLTDAWREEVGRRRARSDRPLSSSVRPSLFAAAESNRTDHQRIDHTATVSAEEKLDLIYQTRLCSRWLAGLC